MNTYSTSNGERLKKSVIDALVKKAKKEKLRQQFEEYRYNFCETCGISNGTYIDCSHQISVKKCQEEGKTELAFDVNNITILCRKHHEERDKLNIQYAGSKD